MMLSVKAQSQQGFSLIEIVIVLAIIGVLSTGFLFGVSEFKAVQNMKEAQQKTKHLKEQLLMFGKVNKFLPCPDSDFDGFEDRSGSACLTTVGTAPYVDLGLKREEAQDAWGNFIRYSVNQNANLPSLICDKRTSASFFCNSGFGVNWFTFTETPPLSINRGGGNYYVCNQNPAICDGTSIGSASNLASDTASIVLVAYNEDGHQAVTNCGLNTGASLENCDVDAFYQQGAMSSEEGNFYDDIVLAINGAEIKNAMLGNVVVWNEFPAIAGQGQLTATYEDFDITATDNQASIETAGDDVVFVKRNVDTALNLGSGDDYIAIGNDLNTGAILDTGAGNDTVYIVGQANANVLLGDGDDAFVLATDLTQTLDASTGNDKVWIQGNVISGAVFTLGAGDDVVWLGESSDPLSGGLTSNVDGGLGYDILVLENMTQSEWNTNAIFQTYVANFELVVFSDNGSGIRESATLP